MPAGPTVKMAVLPNLRVKKRIQELSVLEHIVLQSPLQCEAALFQNARRSGIVRIRLCIDPMERKFYEALVYECWDHFRHYAVSPKFLTQPKAEFDDMSMDVLTNANTDAANRRLTDVDTKICHGLLRCCAAQEFICVVDRVWVREQIAQAKPDTAIVCMLRERRRIIGTPLTNGAPLERELINQSSANLTPAFCTSRYGKSQISDSS